MASCEDQETGTGGDGYLTLLEVAEYTGCHLSTVYKRIRATRERRHIPSVCIDGVLMIKRSDLEAIIDPLGSYNPFFEAQIDAVVESAPPLAKWQFERLAEITAAYKC